MYALLRVIYARHREPKFDVDTKVLEHEMKRRQKQIHPDKLAQSSKVGGTRYHV